MRDVGRTTLGALLIALAGAGAAALSISDPPDSEVNPQNGDIEVVDSAWWTGANYNVRYVINAGDGEPVRVLLLSTHPLDDRGPRIAITPQGDSWFVWWRDGATDEVLSRKRDFAAGTLTGIRRVSLPGESSRNPEIAWDGAATWVAYELDPPSGGTGVAVTTIVDEPEPIPSRTLLATSGFGGDVNVRIEAESGHLWVTWIDSASEVGWREYDPATASWSPAAFESYAEDDVAAARQRIRSAVLGN